MNVVFLSPAFPPTAPAFCVALRERGAAVLGIGDSPLAEDDPTRRLLTDYVYVPEMHRYDVLALAVERLREEYGDIYRIESSGEHWLEAEARLRSDFRVDGVGAFEIARLRSKLAMAETFASAGIAHPPGERATLRGARALSQEHGYPLVLKPECGSGAAETFTVASDGELVSALAKLGDRHIVQPFIAGDIITFDGLCDAAGNIVFATSHRYDSGIMQVRLEQRDGYYYSLREIPSELETLGRRAVAAFGIRERFFHFEFFEHGNGRYTALEINVRPPGGFSTDMMCAAANIDVYGLWADVLLGRATPPSSQLLLHYHTAHAGRRRERVYRLPEEELVKELGDTLFEVRDVPEAFAVTMGHRAYLLRHHNLDALLHAIGLVQARRSAATALDAQAPAVVAIVDATA